MKRRIFACAVIVATMALMGFGSMAYFSTDGTATNVITTGSISIELKEMSLAEDGETLVPFQDQTDVMPGAQISKIVTVENIGSSDAYIRISLKKAIELAEGQEGDIDLSLVTCDLNTEDWTEKDGYYYYNETLPAGGETTPLFTTVTFSTDMSNLYQNSKATIEVYAQATQAANNGSTALEAAGWPEK